jgi:hypothetical protein
MKQTNTFHETEDGGGGGERKKKESIQFTSNKESRGGGTDSGYPLLT